MLKVSFFKFSVSLCNANRKTSGHNKATYFVLSIIFSIIDAGISKNDDGCVGVGFLASAGGGGGGDGVDWSAFSNTIKYQNQFKSIFSV